MKISGLLNQWAVVSCLTLVVGTHVGCSKNPQAEADAVTSLKGMGVLVVKDNNSGLARVVNLSTMRDQSKSSEAVQQAAELLQPGSANFSGLTLTSEDLDAIAGMKSLNELVLNNTNVDDEGLKKLSGLKRLGTLYLVGTAITDDSFETIAKFPELKVLGLGRTNLTKSLAPLARLKKLTWIEISEMKLTDELFRSLGELPALQTVTMLGSEHNPAIVEELKERNDKLQFDISRGSLGGGFQPPNEEAHGHRISRRGGSGRIVS
jgi:hypothetical protein